MRSVTLIPWYDMLYQKGSFKPAHTPQVVCVVSNVSNDPTAPVCPCCAAFSRNPLNDSPGFGAIVTEIQN